MSTINCKEEMKGNAKCKKSRFEPPFGGLRGTHRVHLWLDGSALSTLPISDNRTFLATVFTAAAPVKIGVC